MSALWLSAALLLGSCGPAVIIAWAKDGDRDRPPAPLAPGAVNLFPAEGAAGVPVRTVVRVLFDQRMDTESVNATTFRLSDSGGSAIPSSVAYDEALSTATLTPNEPLRPGLTYTAVLLPAVRSIAGVPIASERRWQWTTVAPPTASRASPTSLHDVLHGFVVAATFDRAMDPSSVSPATVQLRRVLGGAVSAPVPATLRYDAASLSVSLTPLDGANLIPEATWRFLAQGVLDREGLPSAPLVFDFRTARAPSATVVFPAGPARTDVARLRIRGRGDPGPAGIAALSVLQVPATSADGFVTWHVDLAPTAGAATPLDMSLTDNQGLRWSSPGPVLHAVGRMVEVPVAIASLGGGDYVIADGVIDPRPSGRRNTIVEYRQRIGRPVLDWPDPVVALSAWDGNRLAVLDAAGRVSEIVLGTGVTRLLAAPGASDIDVDTATGEIFAVDPEDRRVLRISTTGSVSTVASGGNLLDPVCIAVEPNSRIIVGCRREARNIANGDHFLLTVNRSNGSTALLSGTLDELRNISRGSGDSMTYPERLARNGSWIHVASNHWGDAFGGAITRVHPSSGDRRRVYGSGVGTGPPIAHPWDIAIDGTGSVLVADPGLGRVLALTDTTRTVVADDTFGSEPAWTRDIFAMATTTDGVLHVLAEGAIWHLHGGTRRLVHRSAAGFISALADHKSGDLVFVVETALHRLNPATGVVRVLAAGLDTWTCRDLALDDRDRWAWIACKDELEGDRLVRVDLTSGHGADVRTGSTGALEWASELGGVLFSDFDRIHFLDAQTLAVSEFSGPNAGSGPGFSNIRDLARVAGVLYALDGEDLIEVATNGVRIRRSQFPTARSLHRSAHAFNGLEVTASASRLTGVAPHAIMVAFGRAIHQLDTLSGDHVLLAR